MSQSIVPFTFTREMLITVWVSDPHVSMQEKQRVLHHELRELTMTATDECFGYWFSANVYLPNLFKDGLVFLLVKSTWCKCTEVLP